MMNNIQKTNPIVLSNLLQNDYFSSLLKEARRISLLNDAEAEKIQIQMLLLLAGQTKRFTQGDSSSLRTENAESILQSIAYSIGMLLKTASGPEAAIAILKEDTLEELYLRGKALVKKQLGLAKMLFMEVKASQIITPNFAYNDTIKSGIPSFFSKYDLEFGAHETLAMIDYPISGQPILTDGIEYILEYLKRLLDENRFCRQFTREQIHSVMLEYDYGYTDLLINICEQVKKRLLPDGTLPEILIQELNKPTAIFEDGQSMEDEAFRIFTDELKECRFASDKVKMIHAKIHSFSDLLDVLGAGCLFDEEFEAVFASLAENEHALLLQEAAAADEDGLTEYEKEWKIEFLRFFEGLPPETIKKIRWLSRELADRMPI